MKTSPTFQQTLYDIAYYKGFKKCTGIEKTIEFLKHGYFKSAETKKLVNTDLFRAKVNYADRLVFTFITYKEKKYILLLEVILNHRYEKSKFLRNVYFTEEDIELKKETPLNVDYINERKEFTYIDKFLSFTPKQNSVLNFQPPMLIIGSAGSGKTSVTIEKLKTLEGKVLYTSLSKHLVESNKELCHKHRNIDFLTFKEVLNRTKRQKNQEVTFDKFKLWAYRHQIKEIEKYYEEFNGILTGTHEYPYYPEKLYLNLGIKQSLFSKDERKEVYRYFQKYQVWLESEKLYDNNIVAFSLLKYIRTKYDFIVIDEIQDFTNMQIYFIFKTLRQQGNFIFTGDSNQILYSNYFSWTNLKAMLLKESQESKVLILKDNYRNSQKITSLANKLLQIKQLRFGSIDKESNYLPNSSSNQEGEIHFFKESKKLLEELNKETEHSVEFAIIVLDEQMKQEVKSKFKSPLIFTIQEIKGLEYKNVILFNFVSNKYQSFNDMVNTLSKEDLSNNLNYARQKDKENRELEKYKIYINSLYVAFTRCIENLYIVEKNHHRIFELLELTEEKKVKIKVKESSKEDWKKEAKKLNKVGKTEQVKSIVKKELKVQKELVAQKTPQTPKIEKASAKKVPKTQVLTKVIKKPKKVRLTLQELEEKVFSSNEVSKSDKNNLFKLAKNQNNLKIIERLSTALNFKSAQSYLKNLNKPTVKKKSNLTNPYASDMSGFNLAELFRMASNYTEIKEALEGNANVDSLDSEGYTTLMLAVKTASKNIVKLLLEHHANTEITHNGKTALIFAEELGNKEIINILKNN